MDVGAIGGSQSHEFMVLAEAGEDGVIICEESGYAANTERAEAQIPDRSDPEDLLYATGGFGAGHDQSPYYCCFGNVVVGEN